MKKPGGEVEPCSFPSDFAARSFVRRLTEQGSSLVNTATAQPLQDPNRLERRVPHRNVGGQPLLRGQFFETEGSIKGTSGDTHPSDTSTAEAAFDAVGTEGLEPPTSSM